MKKIKYNMANKIALTNDKMREKISKKATKGTKISNKSKI